MSKDTFVLNYKGWKIFRVFNNQGSGTPIIFYNIRQYVTRGKGKLKADILTGGEKTGFQSIVLAKRWIGRSEALAKGKGKRKAKAKPPSTKSIIIKHTCIKPENKTFARFRFGSKRDCITYINRTYHNNAKFAYDAIILDHPDKSQNWFDSLPETWICETCKFTVTKTEIMNTYLVRKMGNA